MSNMLAVLWMQNGQHWGYYLIQGIALMMSLGGLYVWLVNWLKVFDEKVIPIIALIQDQKKDS